MRWRDGGRVGVSATALWFERMVEFTHSMVCLLQTWVHPSSICKDSGVRPVETEENVSESSD